MKKPRIVDKKWLVIAIIIVSLVVFSVLEEQKTVSTRAIVLAISLDWKDNEYEMGIQVLKTDGQQDKQEFITYSTTGTQMTEIISKLSQDTGGTVSLCHTMALILGQNLLTKDNDKAIRFFVENEELCNNTMIVASKGSPLEVLSAKLSNGQGGGYYIGGMLRNIVTDLGVIPIIVKDYIKNRYRIGGCVYMPCVSVEKTGDTTFISVKESFVTDGHNYAILSENATKGLSLTLNKLKGGELSYSFDNKMGQVEIVKTSADIKAQKDTATVKIKAKLNDRAYVPENIDEKRSVEALQKNVKSYVEECFKTCQEQGLDIFFLGQRVYAQGKDFYMQSDFLENMQLKVEVDITMK
ncbi:MAG: hypothetical protein K2I46_00665 [Clostridia bacterium]|nr:hypothetical protein [Clostridia bacterium]MDE6471760.1 hypothetical protein [Clostridia bacterium]